MVYYSVLTVLVVVLGMSVRNNCIYENSSFACPGTSRQAHLNRLMAVAIFVLLFFISGFRIAVGNDFWVYRDNFELIAQERVVASEFGFNAIVKVVQWFVGYDNYMPIFAVFSFITCFFFVKAIYDQSEWFAASLFLLMANGFYFSSLNTVRYYLAFAIALYSLKLVWEGKHVAFIALILFTATIHKTVLLVIPIYYLAKINWKKIAIPFVLCGSAALILCRDLVRKVAFFIYPYYEGSYLDDFDISYVNILKAAAVLVFSLMFYKSAINNNPRNRFFFNLNIGALIIFSCLWYLPETTRLGYYLSASNIFLLPSVVKSIEKKKVRIFFGVAIGLCYGIFFVMYLRTLSAIDIRILPYRIWFFAR